MYSCLLELETYEIFHFLDLLRLAEISLRQSFILIPWISLWNLQRMSNNAVTFAGGLENPGSLASKGELRHSFQSLHIHRFNTFSLLQLGMSI